MTTLTASGRGVVLFPGAAAGSNAVLHAFHVLSVCLELGGEVLGARHRWLAPLVRKIVASFPAPPGGDEGVSSIAALIESNPAFQRAFYSGQVPRVRRHLARPATGQEAVVRGGERVLEVRHRAGVGARRREDVRVLTFNRDVVGAEDGSAVPVSDGLRPGWC